MIPPFSLLLSMVLEEFQFCFYQGTYTYASGHDDDDELNLCFFFSTHRELLSFFAGDIPL